jgi:hypothetical protein
VIRSFLFGALIGGTAVWVYRDRLREYVDDKTKVARSRAADTLQSAAEGLQSAKETLEGGLSGREHRMR